MINSEEINNKRVTNNIQDAKKMQEIKTESRQVQINGNSPEILTNTIYTPAFLREQIGKLMRVEFLIGTNNLTDRIGILEDVGASYILLRSIESNNLVYCDIYSIKFVTISSAGYGGILSFQSMNSMNMQNMNNMGMNNMNYNMNGYY